MTPEQSEGKIVNTHNLEAGQKVLIEVVFRDQFKNKLKLSQELLSSYNMKYLFNSELGSQSFELDADQNTIKLEQLLTIQNDYKFQLQCKD